MSKALLKILWLLINRDEFFCQTWRWLLVVPMNPVSVRTGYFWRKVVSPYLEKRFCTLSRHQAHNTFHDISKVSTVFITWGQFLGTEWVIYLELHLRLLSNPCSSKFVLHQPCTRIWFIGVNDDSSILFQNQSRCLFREQFCGFYRFLQVCLGFLWLIFGNFSLVNSIPFFWTIQPQFWMS